MYIRQKNTGDYEIVVKTGGDAALLLYPDLFEEVEGDPPSDCTYLDFEVE